MPKKVVLKQGDLPMLYTQAIDVQVRNITSNLTPAQMNALITDERRRSKLVSDFKKNIKMGKLGLKSRAMEELRANCFPGMPRPSSDEKKAREELRTELVSMLAENSFLVDLHHNLARGNNTYQVPRHVKVLMDTGDFSPETLERNHRLYEAFRPGSTPEEQFNAMLPRLKAVADFDFESMDLTNPQYILEHAKELALFGAMATEMERYAEVLKACGTDMSSDPELKTVIENFDLIHEIGMFVPPCCDMICSSLYPEVGYIDNALVWNSDLDREIVDKGEETTPHDLYINDDGMGETDLSVTGFLSHLSNNQQLASPLLDPTLTPADRIRRFRKNVPPNAKLNTGINLKFPKEEAVEGIAPEKNYDFEHGLPVIQDEETRVIVNHTSFDTKAISGKATYTAPEFHPCLPADAKRVYVKNEQGLYVRAFPEADNANFTGLTEAQLKDIYTTDKKYAYFPAGSTEAKYFSNGSLLTQVDHRDNEHPNAVPRPDYKIRFGYEGNCRINGWMSENDKKALETEAERRQCDVFLLDQQRVREMYAQVYGNNCAGEGTEASRTYAEAMVHTLREKDRVLHPDGTDGITYPPLSHGMSEDDVTALTLLATADPKINGKNMPGDEDGVIMSGFSMVAGDMYIQRGSTPDSAFMDWVLNARHAVKPALTNFYENNDASAMVDIISGGIRVLSAQMNVPRQLNDSSLACFLPCVKVCSLLENHPDLLQAVRDKAAGENRLDEVNMQLENINVQRGLYESVIDARKAQHRLADYEAGTMRSPEGQLLKPSVAEADALKLKVQTAKFLEEASALYKTNLNNSMEQQVTDIVTSLVNQFMKDASLSEADRSLAAGNSNNIALVLQNNNPNAPALRLAFADNGGMELVQDAIRTAGPTARTEDILNVLVDEGLIPADGVKGRDFDYVAGARDYNRLLGMNYNVNDMRRLASEEGLTVGEWRKLTLSEADMKADGISAEAAKTVKDWRATYDEIKQAAGNRELTVREYCENLQAATQQLAEANTLNDVRAYAAERGISCDQFLKNAGDLGLDAAGYGEYLLYEKQCDTVKIGYEAGRVAKELGLSLQEVSELAETRGMTVASYGDMMVEENNFAQSGISAAARMAVKELGLSYEDVSKLAEIQGTTVAEYGNRVLEQEKQADRPTVIRTRLTGVEYQLETPELAENLTGTDYCNLMKELNSISLNHQQDLYTTFRSGELMTELYRQMKQYETAHPEFVEEKQRLLKTSDFSKAMDTVKRGQNAGKQLKVQKELQANDVLQAGGNEPGMGK